MNRWYRLFSSRASILSRDCIGVLQGQIQPRRVDVNLATRCLSGLASPTTTTTTASKRRFSSAGTENEPELVLYEKSPGHLAIVKSGFGFSCFHSVYWVWYAMDFVPTVNAAAMTELHVDPMIPTVGLVFACIVQAIFTGYPLRLVSKLAWRPASRELAVYTYTLPLVRPASTPSVHAVGDVRLDPASVEARRIASLGGLQIFRGMLTIGKANQWPPYLVDVRQAQETKEPEILLELLLQPERIEKDAGDDSKSGPRRRSGAKKKPRGRRRN